MAVLMEPKVSPVITAVGAASPYPTWPVSVTILTTTSSMLYTVLRAVLKGFLMVQLFFLPVCLLSSSNTLLLSQLKKCF